MYITPQGLGRHRQSTHGYVNKEGKVQCSIQGCSAWMMPYSVGRHLRHVHGIYGGVSGRRRGRPPGAKNKTKTVEVDSGHKEEKLPPLTAEQITQAAAVALWPAGIPHDKLTTLMRWNTQTHDFLAEVHNEQRRAGELRGP